MLQETEDRSNARPRAPCAVLQHQDQPRD